MERSKMRKIQRSTQSSDQSEDIPLDLIMEILSRLPGKSIGRCRSVSRLWSSITTTPYFFNSFMTRSLSSSRPCVLVIFRKLDKLFVFWPPVHQKTNLQVENDEFTIPNNGYLRYEAVHGLIYVETCTHFMIRNPMMKRFFTLPKLEGKFKTGFLGYDPIEGRYKALCILEEKNEIMILTLGAQESWRSIESKAFPSDWHTRGRARCINGVIYFEGSYGGSNLEHAIMRFDMRSEKLSLVKFPTEKRSGFLVSYEGRLALANSFNNGVELWTLEDAENHQWIYKHIPSPLDPKGKLKAVSDTGEFVYSYTRYKCCFAIKLGYIKTKKLHEYFGLTYLDPKKNRRRIVGYGGIPVEDIRRLDDIGFDFRTDWTDVSVIPNHTESLMSL